MAFKDLDQDYFIELRKSELDKLLLDRTVLSFVITFVSTILAVVLFYLM